MSGTTSKTLIRFLIELIYCTNVNLALIFVLGKELMSQETGEGYMRTHSIIFAIFRKSNISSK